MMHDSIFRLKIPLSTKMLYLVELGVLTKRMQRYFMAWCARRAMKAEAKARRNPDPRSQEAAKNAMFAARHQIYAVAISPSELEPYCIAATNVALDLQTFIKLGAAAPWIKAEYHAAWVAAWASEPDLAAGRTITEVSAHAVARAGWAAVAQLPTNVAYEQLWQTRAQGERDELRRQRKHLRKLIRERGRFPCYPSMSSETPYRHPAVTLDERLDSFAQMIMRENTVFERPTAKSQTYIEQEKAALESKESEER